MSFLRSSRGRWYFLAALWMVVITLGIGGFIQQAHDAGQPRSIWDTLYLTLQLATLDYDGSQGPMNWRLQIGRFVVPVMAASTVLQTASVVFADEFNRWRIGRSSGHSIVAGLGDVGRRLARALADSGERVVAIDADPARVAAVKHSDDRIAALVGDPTDAVTLKRVRVDRARRIVIAVGDDSSNVAAASAAARAAGSRRKALRCAVQLSDVELASLLRAADLDAAGGVRLSYFSLYERAARALLSEHPPFACQPGRPLVIGLGQFGRSLVVALGQQWAHLHPGEVLRPTLVDANAAGRWAELVLRHPALEEVCRPSLIDLDLEAPSSAGLAAFAGMLATDPPNWVAVVVDDERLALANAVFLHQRLARGSVPIVVRMGSAAGLGALLDPASGSEQAFPGVTVFPFLDRTCTLESVDGGIREQLAEAVHEDYLAMLAPGSAAGGLQRPWGDLDDDQRDLSRRRVDGIVGDLAVIGCELQPLRRWGAVDLLLTDPEVQQLAQREHQRWFDDRAAAGWTHGDVRDNAARRNPLLVGWDDLPAGARESNLEAVRALQPLLARAGFEAVRR
ncbi:MAG: RyR protein [Nocardioides sp.]|nr:RyR protein [Nocardioides sp.]